MSDEKKIPRLGKAAGEFNVAINSIVSLLKKKRIDIDENPNTKLTPEIYDILIKEFQGEKMVKEESKKLDIGVYSKKVEEIKHPEEQHVPTPVVPKPPVEQKSEVKVKAKVTTPPVKEVIQNELEPVKENNEITDSTKIEEKIEEKQIPNAVVEEIKTSKPDQIEHIETVVIDLSKNIKVIDKIDISKFEQKKSKKNKSKKEKKQEGTFHEKEQVKKEVKPEIKPEVKHTEKPKVSEVKPPTSKAPVEIQKPDIKHIETKHIKLTGLKEVGRIDLGALKPKEQTKKENQEHPKSDKSNADKSNADKNRKKRKRIKHHTGKQSDEEKLKLAAQRVEISKEDIERQIKETKQRMEPLGKSKTSKRRREKRALIHSEMMETEMQELQDQKKLKVTEFITANDLSALMNIPVNQIISTCMSIGLFVSINQRLDAETIALLAEEYGFEVEFVGVDIEESVKTDDEDKPEDLLPRHPIITVMGHVDHGKTSLLDYIRKTNVIAGEAGGITQHIGAYLVNLPDGRKITFLDTPGHEAFTAMRARGAKVTDLCIIVIAADDAVMPQTVEAINHAQAAGVPMVFAITKIDKANAAPEKIREGLANMNILVEDWGGKYQCQEINSKQGTNIDILLEKILLEAEMLDLKANPNRHGVGTVLESALDKGKGYVAKVLIQNGTIKIGDPILAGNYYGKVKALFNERNQSLKEAGPATPILLLGLNGAPQAGDILKVSTSEHDARIAATKRAQLAREMGLRTQKHITLDEIGRRIAIGDFKELNIIVKGDVDGSVEALSDSLLKLSTEQVQVNVIHKSVGAVTESDVLLASASNAIIVAFQVRPSSGARKLAEQEQIDIRIYSIIYTAINEIKDAIAGMHTPEIREKILCNLEVREVFKITKVGNIAGCMALDGKLQRNTKIRLIRDGIVIYSGKLGSLKRFKDDVKEVVTGQDCGLNIENFNDIKVGDIIEGYEEYEVKVTL
ncbi:MAG: translation initiation factor IF-2 [Bacteroidetes bacterium]|nr:translation initiation factor IF-2 [Bacteroidota bacterium]MCL1969130.1 translation initiation factor IF-2 [Bacteroidota bacterium]